MGKKVNNPKGVGLPGVVQDMAPGENARYLRHAIGIFFEWEPIDIADIRQVEARIVRYFNYCIDNDMKPTTAGLAGALGIDRKTLHNWKVGYVREVSHFHVVKKAFEMLESLWEDYMMNGKINPASGIFLGVNNYGYSNKQEIEVGSRIIDAEKEASEVQKEYLEEMKALEIEVKK